MITVEQIIGYLEGRLEEHERWDPKTPVYYVLEEIIKYINKNRK